jgi:hypothetical protein
VRAKEGVGKRERMSVRQRATDRARETERFTKQTQGADVDTCIFSAYCSPLQHTATHCNSLQLTATHCNSLQHTIRYNTSQHIATLITHTHT